MKKITKEGFVIKN